MNSTKIRPSRTTQLAEAIRQRIVDGHHVDGDLFMTEAQLAEEYGVSRTITREAVNRLRELGMLEGRKRKGLLVRRPDPVQLLSRSLPALARSEEDVNELHILRYVLEVGAIEYAVQNATADQIARLKLLADDFERAVKNDEGNAREIELELAYHGLILQMSGSTLLTGMQQMLVELLIKCYPDATTPKTEERVIWQHHAIADAIEARDVERARALIRLHFQPRPTTGPANG